jgi:hypothetical protein
MIGSILFCVTAGLTLVGVLLSVAVWVGTFQTGPTRPSHSDGGSGERVSGAAPQAARRFRAISVVTARATGGRMGVNRATHLWSLVLGGGVDRVRGRIEAIGARHRRVPDSSRHAVPLREDLARFFGDPRSASPAAPRSEQRRPAPVALVPPTPEAALEGTWRRRPARRSPRAVSWSVGAALVVALLIGGGFAYALVSRPGQTPVSRFAPPPDGRPLPPLVFRVGPSPTPAATPALPPPTRTLRTPTPPRSPVADAAALTVPAPPPPQPRPRAAVPAPPTLTPSPARPRSAIAAQPPSAEWHVPMDSMAYSPLLTFTVENKGDAAVAIGSVTTTDPAFRITQDSCSRERLAPADMCHVTVQFQASTPGHYAGELVLPDDTGGPPQRQALSGEAR